MILNEVKRQDLLNKSLNSVKGRQRYKRRSRSSINRTVSNFNKINMDDLFKKGKFSIIVPVRGETDNYEVKIVSTGFLDELHKQMALSKKFDVKTILKTLTGCFDREDIYMFCSCPDFCLDENTKIKLLNNQVKTVKELKEMFDKGEELWVYSTDESGDFQPGKVKDIWISGYESEMIEVTLNNRRSIITTSNHKYRLKNGEYEEAQNLKIGQSLMSIKFEEDFDYKVASIKKLHHNEPVPVYDISIEKYNNFYVDAGVILHNCYRYQYWATKNKYNSGAAQPSNGKWIRNPDDSLGSGCKHCLLVLSNNSWILPCCRVIYNYTTWMEEHKQQMYAEQIYPAIYEKEYEDGVQLDLLATDELSKGDDDEIKAGNIHKGRDTKGRFTSDQEKGQFKKKQEPNNNTSEEEQQGEEEQ